MINRSWINNDLVAFTDNDDWSIILILTIIMWVISRLPAIVGNDGGEEFQPRKRILTLRENCQFLAIQGLAAAAWLSPSTIYTVDKKSPSTIYMVVDKIQSLHHRQHYQPPFSILISIFPLFLLSSSLFIFVGVEKSPVSRWNFATSAWLVESLGRGGASIVRQIHLHKCTNKNAQIPIHKYKYTNTNTQIPIPRILWGRGETLGSCPSRTIGTGLKLDPAQTRLNFTPREISKIS